MAKEYPVPETTSLPAPVCSPQSPPAQRRKLTGRAFYESLGSPRMVLAPMVDQSEFAWRKLTRSFMKSDSSESLLAYSPMLHARMFTETEKFRAHHFQPTKISLASPHDQREKTFTSPYLDGNPSFDRPLFVQFCANSPNELLEAARYVAPYCDAVDLNLGCPQGIARKGSYGAFLQEDWDLIYRLINNLHRNLDVPVTAKIRILETKEKTLAYAKRILSAGASIITIHGRQRDQKGHKTGLADWSVLRYLRQHLPPDTVIFANGNILRHEDIHRCLEETGADGVMSAEGNLYDPAIFSSPPPIGVEGREYWRGRNGIGGYRMDAVFRRYMDIIYEYVLEKPRPQRKPLFLPSDPVHNAPPTNIPTLDVNDAEEQPLKKRQKRSNRYIRPTSPSLLAMQPHLFHLLRSLVSKHTTIRDELAKCRAGDLTAYENVLQMTESAVRKGLLEYEANPAQYDEAGAIDRKVEEKNEGKDEGSVATARACKRPWWVCQPHVRPLPREALENGSLTMSKKDKRRLEEEEMLREAEKAATEKSARETLDLKDGLPQQEIPKQAMVAG